MSSNRDAASTFELALAHVLAAEGGYSDDPYDPGGPTNKGITLADYAQHRGVAIEATNRQRLVDELKRIAPDVVRDIYLRGYWQAGQAGALPPALGFMHFDTAVNQGLGTAARLLQHALGVVVDGRIGPMTLAAAATAEVTAVLERYAELRRARYRELSHFWRFGRGWLARVDATVKKASSLIDAPPLGTDHPVTGDKAMPNIPPAETAAPAKWWGQSMTIWGALITALTTVLPVLAPVLGLDLTADMVRQVGQQVVQVGQALGGLVGTLMTIYGRSRAATRLELREVRLHL